MNRLRVAAFLAIAAVGSACLDLTGLPPLSTDSARDVLREFCGCDRLAIINLTDTCEAIVEAMPDDSDAVALAAGACSGCYEDFEACWSTLTAPAERELCSGDGDLGAAGDACTINDNCDSGMCVGGTCAGCEAGLVNGSVCYSPRECVSGACRLDLEALKTSGSSLSGICSDACSGCLGANQAPEAGVCLDAAIAARELAECLCAPMGFPSICRGDNGTQPCGDLPMTGPEVLKDCVAEIFGETDASCSTCLLGARADQCDSEIMACDGSLAQPQPQDGG